MYNIGELKSIPLAEVATRYGIKLDKKHGRLWGKLRPEENTASFSINLAKNLWYDFGSYRGGSTIDLVMELEGVDKTTAINRLAEMFGIKNETVKGWSPLTDSQYKELNIEPSLVTLNFNYDLRVHTPGQLARWNQKYGMHITQLADLHPEKYNQLVKKIGTETISSSREAYITKIKHAADHSLSPEQRNLYKMWAAENAKEINYLVDLLIRAIKEDSLGALKTAVTEIKALKVDLEADIARYSNKKNSLIFDNTPDQTIRDNVVDAYKSLFNYNAADYFSIEAAMALYDFNKSVSDVFLPADEIKKLYKSIGNKLCILEEKRSEMLKKGEAFKHDKESLDFKVWSEKFELLKIDLQETRNLFLKAQAAIDGLREASLNFKKDMSQQSKPCKEISRTRGDDAEMIT